MAVCASPVKLLGQTLFLGASVSSFNSNMGWGGSGSSLTVELVEDNQPFVCYPEGSSSPIAQYPTTLVYADDHYYTCGAPLNDSCYVNEKGEVYNSNAIPAHTTKNIPGKLYYAWTESGLVSRYWVLEDPGFFGVSTRVAPDGTLNEKRIYKYNIIGTPVVFKMADFTFTGLIESWERHNRVGTVSYSVQISSVETLLNESYVILNKYPGSIFSKIAGKPYGGPKNYVGPGVEYVGNIKEGAIPNVFNVYGFLESMGMNNFGGAKKTEDGIPSAYALDALAVLTCCEDASVLKNLNKTAFSPFGRIMSKTMETTNSISITPNFKTYAFGVIPPTTNTALVISDSLTPIPRCVFGLDLSAIKRPPLTHRMSEDKMTISQFIDNIIEANGSDRSTAALSFAVNGNVHNIIKIKTIERTMETHDSTVEKTILSLEQSGFSISSTTYGKEKNNNVAPRIMKVGGPQQRLLQAKNYRLAYNQTNYIYHPSIDKFVNLNRFGGANGRGKLRVPSYFSTRNTSLSSAVLGADIHSLFDTDEAMRELMTGNKFYSLDNRWKDHEISTNPENIVMGNYPYSFGIPAKYTCANKFQLLQDPDTATTTQPSSSGADPSQETILPPGCVPPRYNPLYYDTISPFFGYHGDNIIDLSKDNNISRYIRPVYQDTWDGQLAIAFYVSEIPLLNLGLLPMPAYVGSTQQIANLPGPAGATAGPGLTAATPAAGVGSSSTAPASPGPQGAAPTAPGTPGSGTPPSSGTPTPTPNPSGSLAAQYTPNPSPIGFMIRETELRCAMKDTDAYITYCLGKSKDTKPDLYNLLVGHYMSRGLFFGTAPPPSGGGADAIVTIGQGPGMGTTLLGSAVNAPGTPTTANPVAPVVTKSDLQNFNIYLNHNFIKDLKTLAEFVREIGSKYYGKQYMVKLLDLSSSQDSSYAQLDIVVGGRSLPVFKGNRKINQNYKIADKAWEEVGNYLDDCIVIGDENYYTLCEDNGLIPPIIGYNATDNIDYLKQSWCMKALADQQKILAEHQAVLDELTIDIALAQLNVDTIDREEPNDDLFADPSLFGKYQAWQQKIEAAMLVVQERAASIAERSKKIKEQNKIIGGYMGCDPSITRTYYAAGKKKQQYTAIGSSQFLTQSLDITKLGTNSSFVMVATHGRSDAFGNIILAGSKKLYSATTVNTSEIAYLSPHNLSDPRAIIAGLSIPLENTSYAYTHDPNLTIISNIAMEDLIYYDHMLKLSGRSVTADELASLQFLGTFTGLTYGGTFAGQRKQDLGQIGYQGSPANQSYKFATMLPKMAHPLFAAVPLISNQYCYGPWTNYPSVRADLVYPNAANPNTAIENMISNTKIDILDDLVPWLYGGMSFLDAKVISDMQREANYQFVMEKGSMTVEGAPIFNLGGRFEPLFTQPLPANSLKYGNEVYTKYTNIISYIDAKIINNAYIATPLNYPTVMVYNPNNYLATAPIISSISMSLGGGGSSTTNYSFKTYDKKTGLYSKEYADLVKRRTAEIIKDRKTMSSNRSKIGNDFLVDSQKILQKMSDSNSDSMSGYGSKLYGSSPVETLIGRSTLHIPYPSSGNTAGSDIGAAIPDNSPSGLYKLGRTRTWTGLYMGDEVGAELINGYESKSVMSLDGIFSPLSFYPTQYVGTYSISSHITGVPVGAVVCPRCHGAGNLPISFIDYKSTAVPRVPQQISYPCPVCSRSKLVVKNAKILDSMKNKTAAQQIAIALKDTKPEINIYAYNPIVVPYGEFRNPNAQTVAGASGLGLDKCRHSISIVGRGEMPIDGELTLGISNNLYGEKLVDPSGHISSTGVSSDYYEHDIFNQMGGGAKTLQNQRFFGLRGPLMLHSWGYDTAGYPVPNLNDEPKDMDEYGRFRRFILTSGGLNDYKKEGVFINSEGQLLGDTVGRNYEWDAAAVKYKKIKAKPSKYFHLNWAEHPELWPVGPIDLRWDDSRKLWAAGGGGCTEELLPPSIITNSTDISTLNEFLSSKESNTCPYKMVNITLEEDLIKEDDSDETYATRGFIDDIEYSKEPLTRGYRRLVYVVDKAGYSAPRGTKLLCKYSIDSGFYEPISKPVTMAKGKIVNNTNVKIEQHYIQGRRAGIVPSFVVPFDNPMEFQTTSGKNGMFVYINGKWTLTSIKN